MEKPRRDSSTIVRVTKVRVKAQPHQFLGGVDPQIEAANKRHNTSEYNKIRSIDDDFEQIWNDRMKAQKAAGVRGEEISNLPNPQQTRSLEEIIHWWKSNNPYMTEGRVTAPLSDTLEGGKNGNEILDQTIHRNPARPEDDTPVTEPIQPDDEAVPGGR